MDMEASMPQSIRHAQDDDLCGFWDRVWRYAGSVDHPIIVAICKFFNLMTTRKVCFMCKIVFDVSHVSGDEKSWSHRGSRRGGPISC